MYETDYSVVLDYDQVENLVFNFLVDMTKSLEECNDDPQGYIREGIELVLGELTPPTETYDD